MSSNEPDIGTQLAARGAGASATQSGGGGAGTSLDQMSFAEGFSKGTKGLDNSITKGGDDLMGLLNNNNLMNSLGGKINAFEGMQTLNCAPPPSNVMTPPSLNQGSIIGINQGQGQGH